MKTLYRLKAKKAFTLVELIVVMAIIGIITGIMFPMLSNAGKPQAAAAKAKSFYFMTQDVFIDFKATQAAKPDGEPYLIFDRTNQVFVDKLPAGASMNTPSAPYVAPVDKNDNNVPTYMFLCAKAEKEKGFTSAVICVNYTANSTPDRYVKLLLPDTAVPPVESPEIKDMLNVYSQPEDEGYYFALIDSQCRVVMTYWSPIDIKTLADESPNPSGNTIPFTDMDTVSYNYIVGSYPPEYSAKDINMFAA